MRYIKVFVLACLFFLGLVFFFQNQTVLSQSLMLKLDLFFIKPMESISLPFYFIIIVAFFIGVLLALSFLIWDKMNSSAKLMSSKWEIKKLQKKISAQEKDIEATHAEFAKKVETAAESAAAKTAEAPAQQ
ncbi:MAG: LapA family protein [Desulfovibrio sp.]|nr:LapA family protein [Desulfovibrio sp.]